MDLIKSPWSDVFSEFGRSVQSRAILAAPFISSGPLADLANSFDSANPSRFELITNLAADSLLQGTVDSAAIANFCRSLPEAAVRHLPGLHAKMYVADNHSAIITSGNLTRSALNRSYEYGIRITEQALVRQIADDRVINGVRFDKIWKHTLRGSQVDPRRQGRIELRQKKW